MKRTKSLTIDTKYLLSALEYVRINVADGYSILNDTHSGDELEVDDQLEMVHQWISELQRLSLGGRRDVHVLDTDTYVTLIED